MVKKYSSKISVESSPKKLVYEKDDVFSESPERDQTARVS